MSALLGFVLAIAVQDLEREHLEHELYRARMAAAESAARLGELAVAREWLDAVDPALRGFEWRVDASTLDESLTRWERDGGAPRVLAFDPSGAHLALGTRGGAVELWRATDRKLVWRVSAHEAAVTGVSFDARGERLVTSSHDRTVRLWNAADGTALGVYRGHAYPVGGAVFEPDGTSVASCSYERPDGGVVGTVHVWSALDGTRSSTLEGGRKPLVDLTLSPDGSRLAAASWDFCAFGWYLGAGDAPTCYAIPDEGIYNAVDGVAWSPDGTLLAAGSKDRTARIFDTVSARLVATLRGHTGYVSKLAFAPDGATLATASTDGTLRLWSVPEGEERAVLRGHADDVLDLAWAPDGSSLVSASADGTLRSWSPDPGAYGPLRIENGAATYVVRFDPGGGRLASCSYDGRVQIRSVTTGELLSAWQAHADDQSCHMLDWSPDGRVLASGSYDGTVRLWDSVTHEELARLEHEAGLYWMRWSPDGERIAVCEGARVVVWDVAARERLTVFEGHASTVLTASFAPDSRRCVSTARDGAALVWECDSGTPIARIEGLGPDVAEAVFLPDGERLVVAGRSGEVALFGASDGSRLRDLARSREGIDHLALSPEGARVALATDAVALLDVEHGGLVGSFRPHRDRPYAVDFDPLGERLASCSTDGTIAILDTEPRRERAAEVREALAERERAARAMRNRLTFGTSFAELADEVCADKSYGVLRRTAWLEALTLAAAADD